MNTLCGTKEFERLVVQWLRRLSHHLYLHSRQMVRRCGLTAPQALALQELLENGGMPVSALAERLSMKSGTLCGILDRLESRRLVERKRSQEDRRAVIVDATEEAREWFHDDLSHLNPAFPERLANLSEEEKSSLLVALHRLAILLGDPDVPESLPMDTDALKPIGIPLEELIIHETD